MSIERLFENWRRFQNESVDWNEIGLDDIDDLDYEELKELVLNQWGRDEEYAIQKLADEAMSLNDHETLARLQDLVGQEHDMASAELVQSVDLFAAAFSSGKLDSKMATKAIYVASIVVWYDNDVELKEMNVGNMMGLSVLHKEPSLTFEMYGLDGSFGAFSLYAEVDIRIRRSGGDKRTALFEVLDELYPEELLRIRFKDSTIVFQSSKSRIKDINDLKELSKFVSDFFSGKLLNTIMDFEDEQ